MQQLLTDRDLRDLNISLSYHPLQEQAELVAQGKLDIAAALRTPGLTRLGHAVYAARDPHLLDAIAASGVTVECALSCNVVLGAAPSYGEHPMRRFVEREGGHFPL